MQRQTHTPKASDTERAPAKTIHHKKPREITEEFCQYLKQVQTREIQTLEVWHDFKKKNAEYTERLNNINEFSHILAILNEIVEIKFHPNELIVAIILQQLLKFNRVQHAESIFNAAVNYRGEFMYRNMIEGWGKQSIDKAWEYFINAVGETERGPHSSKVMLYNKMLKCLTKQQPFPDLALVNKVYALANQRGIADSITHGIYMWIKTILKHPLPEIEAIYQNSLQGTLEDNFLHAEMIRTYSQTNDYSNLLKARKIYQKAIETNPKPGEIRDAYFYRNLFTAIILAEYTLGKKNEKHHNIKKLYDSIGTFDDRSCASLMGTALDYKDYEFVIKIYNEHIINSKELTSSQYKVLMDALIYKFFQLRNHGKHQEAHKYFKKAEELFYLREKTYHIIKGRVDSYNNTHSQVVFNGHRKSLGNFYIRILDSLKYLIGQCKNDSTIPCLDLVFVHGKGFHSKSAQNGEFPPTVQAMIEAIKWLCSQGYEVHNQTAANEAYNINSGRTLFNVNFKIKRNHPTIPDLSSFEKIKYRKTESSLNYREIKSLLPEFIPEVTIFDQFKKPTEAMPTTQPPVPVVIVNPKTWDVPTAVAGKIEDKNIVSLADIMEEEKNNKVLQKNEMASLLPKAREQKSKKTKPNQIVPTPIEELEKKWPRQMSGLNINANEFIPKAYPITNGPTYSNQSHGPTLFSKPASHDYKKQYQPYHGPRISDDPAAGNNATTRTNTSTFTRPGGRNFNQ